MSESVYIAKAMKENPDEPVFTTRVGKTPQAAKDTVVDVMETHYPVIVHGLQWDEPNTEYRGWIFHLKERDLYE